MYQDPRGGHNQKSFNKNFFKTWSPTMAYTLGLIFSDGAIEDVRKSSRTCYVSISSKDYSLIQQVKQILSSNHNIYIKKPRLHTFKDGKTYLSAKQFVLRIGSKEMFQDLINLKVTPRKSLRLKFPDVPKKYFKFFLRGYFDGDGCISIYKRNNKTPRPILVFTCGTKSFLIKISKNLERLLQLTPKNVSRYNRGAYDLRYRTKEGLKTLDYMYTDLKKAPFLDRKYKIYLEAKNTFYPRLTPLSHI